MARSAAVVMCVVLVVVVARGAVAEKWVCTAKLDMLLPCNPSIKEGPWSAPSTLCCSNLRVQEQEGCICPYLQDPVFYGYINRPNFLKTLTSCGIRIPPACPTT
uniref:Bifunctional inhibitor/plant lipid transfer protein/seed storage helical domain-containing protein n=2 Tax=Aegilops tauschii TaxID=37682 RepID=A0A453DBG2_AEGTS